MSNATSDANLLDELGEATQQAAEAEETRDVTFHLGNAQITLMHAVLMELQSIRRLLEKQSAD